MKKIKTFYIIALCSSTISIFVAAKSAPSIKRTYATGKLEGKTLSDLYARYLGVSNKTKIGNRITIDFQKNFSNMWQKKNARCGSAVVKQASEKLVYEYDKSSTPISFSEYKDHTGNVVEVLKKGINWTKVKNIMRLSQKDAELVRDISLSFNGKDMTAYILAELMPSADGKLNVAMLDFILRNAGKEYIEGIPALYDSKTSFGPYQFTEYAVFSVRKDIRGASVINQAVTANQKIPGSVIRLRGDDHHRAAYLFAVYNLALMVKALNAHEKQELRKSWKKNRDDLFFYCATAHHSPVDARRAAKLWLDNDAKYSFEKSCNWHIASYAKKTRRNLAAI